MDETALRWALSAALLLAACGSRSGLDIADPPGSEGGPDASTAVPGCGDHPSESTVIYTDEDRSLSGFDVADGSLYLGLADIFPTTFPVGGIYRIDGGGGALTEIPIDVSYFSSALEVRGRHLYYKGFLTIGDIDGPWRFEYPSVAVHSLDDGLVVEIDQIVDDADVFASFAVTEDERLFYELVRPGLDDLRVFDPATLEDELLRDSIEIHSLLAAGDGIYLWWGDVWPGDAVVEHFDGATFVELGRSHTDECRPAGADDEVIYMWCTGRGFEAWARDGGERVSIVRTGPEANRRVAVDDRFLYWADGPWVRFVPKGGGEARTLNETDRGDVLSIVTDGCGVWWTILGFAQVVVQSAP